MAMRKAVRNNSFTFEELKKVVLDVDISLKGHPLSYTEDRKQLPILTQTQFCPASWMLYLRERVPEEMQGCTVGKMDAGIPLTFVRALHPLKRYCYRPQEPPTAPVLNPGVPVYKPRWDAE